MRKSSKLFTALGAAVLMTGSLAIAPQAMAVGEMPSKKVCEAVDAAKDPVTAGGCLATDRKRGNCHACHTFAGIEKTRLQAGDLGPPLAAMKQRFPDKKKLRAQVWDAEAANRITVMPPFGRHKIVSDKDIDLIVEWLYTL
jgi:sulfur-oxidizing protein SoxX